MKRRPTIFLDNEGLYVILRWGNREPNRDAIGFVIKRKGRRTFSERNGGYKRARCIGPFYVRTYASRPINWNQPDSTK